MNNLFDINATELQSLLRSTKVFRGNKLNAAEFPDRFGNEVNIRLGDIIKTSGYNLKVKHIFQVSPNMITFSDGKRVIRDFHIDKRDVVSKR